MEYRRSGFLNEFNRSEFMRSPRSPSPDTRSCSKSPKRKSDGTSFIIQTIPIVVIQRMEMDLINSTDGLLPLGLKRSSTTPDLARLSENQEPVTITHENSDSIVGKVHKQGVESA